MTLAVETFRSPTTLLPERPMAKGEEHGLDIDVVFTSYKGTLAALKEAGSLAKRLGGHITLLVPQVVPILLPITRPPVLLSWIKRRLRAMASQSPVDITVRLILCRDSWKTLAAVLKPHSLVLVGGRHSWWPTAAVRLARRLQDAGHEVIFAEAE